MKAILLILVSLSICACVKISDKQAQADNGNGAGTMRDASVGRTEHPNIYQVSMLMPEGAQIVQRSLLQNGNPLDIKNLSLVLENGQFIDPGAEGGKEYIYEMGFIDQGEFKILQSHQVQIPEDLVISGIVNLSQDTDWSRYQRIFFLKDSAVMTHQFNLTIKTEEIIAQGATIRSFPENTKQGRSAGLIAVTTNTGRGILSISLFGEDGADGLSGAGSSCSLHNPIDAYEHGKDGQNGGNSGQIYFTIIGTHDLKILMDSKPGQGGQGGIGSVRCMGSKITQDGKVGRSGEWQNSCLEDFRDRTCAFDKR